MAQYPTMTEARSGSIREIIVLTCIAFGVQACVFQLVFPGYFSPLWPHHSDFYMPLQLHHSPTPFAMLLRWPRPIGAFYLTAVGSLGLHLSILATMVVVLLNCALTAVIARRSLGIERGGLWLTAFVAYTFLLFSHPRCYFIYTWDMLAQVSYLLAALAALLLLFYESWLAVAVSIVLLFLALLTKETYAVSALVLATAWGLYRYSSDRRRALAVAAAPLLTFGASLFVSALNGSPFTGARGTDHDTYKLVLAPRSLAAEWVRYAAEFSANRIATVLLPVTAVLLFVLAAQRTARWLPLLLIAAGAAAWLPNSVLPNHHFAGYSWSAGYLFFAPVLLGPRLWASGLAARAVGAVLTLIAFVSPAFAKELYKSDELRWDMAQESTQRKLLPALDALFRAIPEDGQRQILVTGINFPYSPFAYGWSLSDFPNASRAQIDVLVYGGPTPNPQGRVRFVSKDQVDLVHYDEVWAFGNDGGLVLDGPAPKHLGESYASDVGLEALDLLLYPELLKKAASRSQEDAGGRLLTCGATLLDYSEFTGAEKCLTRASEAIPANPYPYYFLGLIREKQGDTREAHRMFQKAVALDDPRARNPWFAIKAAD